MKLKFRGVAQYTASELVLLSAWLVAQRTSNAWSENQASEDGYELDVCGFPSGMFDELIRRKWLTASAGKYRVTRLGDRELKRFETFVDQVWRPFRKRPPEGPKVPAPAGQ